MSGGGAQGLWGPSKGVLLGVRGGCAEVCVPIVWPAQHLGFEPRPITRQSEASVYKLLSAVSTKLSSQCCVLSAMPPLILPSLPETGRSDVSQNTRISLIDG